MKNEIKEIKDLIKQAEEQLAKLEGKQEFKDGDVVISKATNAIAIYYKPDDDGFFKSYVYSSKKDGFGNYDRYFADNFRLATPEEAQILFDALAKDGKRWNAETKQIEKLRWRAENGKNYWYANEYFNPVEIADYDVYCDKARYNAGNYFQSEAECQAFCDKVKALANGNN